MRSNGTRWLSVLAVAFIAATAALLLHFRRDQRLGQPGLRLSEIRLQDEKGKEVTTNSLYLPETVLDYSSRLLPVQRQELEWLPPDTTFGRRLYQSARDGFQVQVSGVMMGTDRTSIHKPEFCLPAQGFRILRRQQQSITLDQPRRWQLPVARLDAIRELRDANGSVTRQGAVYVYWFVSGSRLSNDHFQRMWWLASDLIRTGELGRWAYLGVLGACPPGQEDAAYARLEELIRKLVPEFQLTLPPETVPTALTAVDPTATRSRGEAR